MYTQYYSIQFNSIAWIFSQLSSHGCRSARMYNGDEMNPNKLIRINN